MRALIFTGRRLSFALPQILGITLFTFLLLRLLPNPAYQLVGPFATPGTQAALNKRLGLDQPVWVQYVKYLNHLVHGDLGQSWFTAGSVSSELIRRTPATLELITISLFLSILFGVGFGVLAAWKGGAIADRLFRTYGLLAGSFPDFWLGLLAAFVFFFLLRWLPAPIGQLGQGVVPPPHVTGMYVFDSVLAGQWSTAASAVGHLILPVFTLVIVCAAPILKMARSTMREMLASDFCTYARASGLSETTVLRYALRNTMPPIVTLIGISYGYLLGGAVLVENVFSWGGLGQWVVESVAQADYFAVQGFILVAALFNLAVYLIVDLIHLGVDPRVEY